MSRPGRQPFVSQDAGTGRTEESTKQDCKWEVGERIFGRASRMTRVKTNTEKMNAKDCTETHLTEGNHLLLASRGKGLGGRDK